MTASWSGNPRTWADQETPTALQFNVEFRDRFDFLSVHTHTGADGDGSAAINPDTVTLDDISTPSAPGANKVVVFSESETARVRAGASGSAVDISLATHTHTQAEGSEYIKDIGSNFNLTSTSYANTQTQAATPSDSTGSSQYLIVHSGHGAARNITGTSSTYHIRLLKDSVQQVETSKAIGSTVETSVSLQLSTSYIALANSSTNFQIQNKKSGTASSIQVYGLGTLVREMQCL